MNESTIRIDTRLELYQQVVDRLNDLGQRSKTHENYRRSVEAKPTVGIITTAAHGLVCYLIGQIAHEQGANLIDWIPCRQDDFNMEFLIYFS